MKLARVDTIREVESERLCSLERRINAVVRLDGLRDRGSYFRYELTKARGWCAVVTEAVNGNARRLAEGFMMSGAASVCCLSIPFWLADGSSIGYEGIASEAVVAEMLLKWAPFDYVLAGFASPDTLTAMVLVTMDDGAILIGSRSFVSACVGDVESVRAEFREVAINDPRADALLAIGDAVDAYSNLRDGETVGLP